jgi:C1A family cysteine protease
MKRLFLILSMLIFFVNNSFLPDDRIQNEYRNFKRQYGKSYRTNLEDSVRYNKFKQNMINVQTLNKDPHATFGVTEFFDLSFDEFKSTKLTLLGSQISPIPNQGMLLGATLLKYGSWDWRNSGAVNPPENQGACGCCFIFSALGNLEGLYKIKYGRLYQLSVQQVLSCSNYQLGCVGGLMDVAYQYLIKSGGAILSSSYSFLAKITTCPALPTPVVQVTGFYRIPTTDENYIANYLQQTGPLSAGIHGDLLYYYQSGIMTVYCPPDLNHAILIVGYGTSSAGVNYWVIKNSWGTSWGESGFFRIKRGIGQCGINKYVMTGYIK